MRELKFRAWDNRRKKMSHDVEIRSDGIHSFYSWQANVYEKNGNWERFFTNIDDERNVIMQYTGLHDKNGKEIYEGDILKCTQAQGEYNAVMDWVDNGFWLRGLQGTYLPNQEYREIIGNIYEDAALIKEMP